MNTKTATNPWLIAVIASIATFMEVLDTTITNVSLRHIAGSLASSGEESTWILTSYLVANGIILPLSGWLSDVFGRKKFFVGCILGFTAASFFCGAANSLSILIIFRIIQGAAGGGLQPTQQAIILDIFPPEKRGAVFAITGITMVVAPILGPTLGGIITDHASWRWIFYINIPVGLFSAYMVWKLVEDSPDSKPKGFMKTDFTSLGFLSLGLATLQIVLDKGQQEDWFASNFILTFAIISFASLVIAIIWLIGQKDPIVDLSLFKDRAFSSSWVLMFIVGFVLYGSNALLPMLVQSHMGYTATYAGLVLSPGGIGVMILMPIVGKLISVFQARYLVVIGLIMGCLGMLYTDGITPQTSFSSFQIIRIVQILGLPFLFIPISTLAFSNTPPDKRNKASSLFALSRNLGGSVGIALIYSYVTRQQQIHQNHLAEHIVPGDIGYEMLLDRAGLTSEVVDGAHAAIYQALVEQAAILAYIDAFKIMGVMMLCSAVFAVILLPSNIINSKSDDTQGAVH